MKQFSSEDESLVGELTVPDGSGPFPTVVFLAGTGPVDRYQQPVLPSGRVIKSEPKQWLSSGLAAAGIATFAWDKRGTGASTGGEREPGDPPGDRDAHASVETDVVDAISAIRFVQNLDDVDGARITVMGHSAGVYFACLVAARTEIPASYVLWGGVHRGIDELMDYIYSQVASYAALGPSEKAIVMENEHSYYSFAVSQVWQETVAAANRGDNTYQWDYEGKQYTENLTRLKQELALPLGDQFRNIQKPTLVVHGDRDINVPVTDAFAAQATLVEAGNSEVSLVVVPGADHGMRIAPAGLDDAARMRERITRSRAHPLSQFFLSAVGGWILDQEYLRRSP